MTFLTTCSKNTPVAIFGFLCDSADNGNVIIIKLCQFLKLWFFNLPNWIKKKNSIKKKIFPENMAIFSVGHSFIEKRSVISYLGTAWYQSYRSIWFRAEFQLEIIYYQVFSEVSLKYPNKHLKKSFSKKYRENLSIKDSFRILRAEIVFQGAIWSILKT